MKIILIPLDRKPFQKSKAKCLKIFDLFQNNMEMMEAARLRLQARYDKDALRAEEKRQEAED